MNEEWGGAPPVSVSPGFLLCAILLAVHHSLLNSLSSAIYNIRHWQVLNRYLLNVWLNKWMHSWPSSLSPSGHNLSRNDLPGWSWLPLPAEILPFLRPSKSSLSRWEDPSGIPPPRFLIAPVHRDYFTHWCAPSLTPLSLFLQTQQLQFSTSIKTFLSLTLIFLQLSLKCDNL